MSWKGRNRLNDFNDAQIEQLIQAADTCVVLQNHTQFPSLSAAGSFKFSRLVGLGIRQEIIGADKRSLSELRNWLTDVDDYVLGFFSYEVKNLLENISSNHQDEIDFPLFHFFVPETVIIESEEGRRVLSHNPNLLSEKAHHLGKCTLGNEMNQISKEDYVKDVEGLKNHIQHGDIYEVNYCVQHKFENTVVNPYSLFLELQANSPAPFSCYVTRKGKHLISSSPERFMRKIGSELLSQPMKGTNRRIANNDLQKESLRQDSKELAENIMITDLVRNDLSRSAKKGSVKVEELCGVYEFPQVNQMISTVTAELIRDVHPLDALLNAFPMGSMTGAPKVSAMKLIDEYEHFARGLYSGAVGYFTPDLDFDFNVVIRSILYNKDKKLVTFPTGGAITINSDPEKEYEECMLKAEPMRQVILDHAG